MCEKIVNSYDIQAINRTILDICPSNIEESKRLAKLATDCARSNELLKAVELYTQAIALNPVDYRFHVNKAVCLEALGWLDNALSEMEIACSLKPSSGMLYLRKAQIFRLLKKFDKAEETLEFLIKNDFDVDKSLIQEEHRCLLLDATSNLCDSYGFEEKFARQASRECKSISNALEYVLCEEMKNLLPEKQSEKARSYADVAKPKVEQEQGPKSPKPCIRRDSVSSMEPIDASRCNTPVKSPTLRRETAQNKCTNLMGYKGVWIGNISLNCSKEKLTNMFKKYGNPNIHFLQKTTKSNCIFVKFDNEESPTKLIQDLYGKLIPSVAQDSRKPLMFHFDCNQEQLLDDFPKNRLPRVYSNGECYDWRTTGCSAVKCGKIHVPINQGIDLQPWMTKSKVYHCRRN